MMYQFDSWIKNMENYYTISFIACVDEGENEMFILLGQPQSILMFGICIFLARDKTKDMGCKS